MANETKSTPPPSPTATTGSYSPQRTAISSNNLTHHQPLLNNTYTSNGNFSPNKMNSYSLDKNEIYSNSNIHNHKEAAYVVPVQSLNGLPSSPSKTTTGTLSSLHYRSLQTAAAIAPRSAATPVPAYSGRGETTQRKRYHTAPREKHRVSFHMFNMYLL